MTGVFLRVAVRLSMKCLQFAHISVRSLSSEGESMWCSFPLVCLVEMEHNCSCLSLAIPLRRLYLPARLRVQTLLYICVCVCAAFPGCPVQAYNEVHEPKKCKIKTGS